MFFPRCPEEEIRIKTTNHSGPKTELKIRRVALGTVGYKQQMCHKSTECAFTII